MEESREVEDQVIRMVGKIVETYRSTIPMIDRSMELERDLGFDTLDIAELVVDMEEAFNVVIEDGAVLDVKTVGDMIDLAVTGNAKCQRYRT